MRLIGSGRIVKVSEWVIFFVGLGTLMAAGTAPAGDLTVNVSDTKGKPVRDAVITFTPSGVVVIPTKLRTAPYSISQKNLTFVPFVLAVPQGATVSFPNQDTVRHHVYSLSPVHPFQLPLYGPGQTRFVEFDQVGTVSLACDIHDSMKAFIRVVDTPWFATTGEDGEAVLKNVPVGTGQLSVWQPLMEGIKHEDSRSFAMDAGDATQAFTIKTRARLSMAGM